MYRLFLLPRLELVKEKEKKARLLQHVQGDSQTQPISFQAGGWETMPLTVVKEEGRHRRFRRKSIAGITAPVLCDREQTSSEGGAVGYLNTN